MYGYKLNNSYTVYVNYYYLNECVKASKGKHITATNYKNYKPTSTPKALSKPLPNNTRVKHQKYGSGIIVNTNDKGIVTVLFNEKTIKFSYPSAFEQGFLVRI